MIYPKGEKTIPDEQVQNIANQHVSSNLTSIIIENQNLN